MSNGGLMGSLRSASCAPGVHPKLSSNFGYGSRHLRALADALNEQVGSCAERPDCAGGLR